MWNPNDMALGLWKHKSLDQSSYCIRYFVISFTFESWWLIIVVKCQGYSFRYTKCNTNKKNSLLISGIKITISTHLHSCFWSEASCYNFNLGTENLLHSIDGKHSKSYSKPFSTVFINATLLLTGTANEKLPDTGHSKEDRRPPCNCHNNHGWRLAHVDDVRPCDFAFSVDGRSLHLRGAQRVSGFAIKYVQLCCIPNNIVS